MYVATVLLRRTEREFWRMSPRKLSALSRAHAQANGDEDSGEGKSSAGGSEPRGYIDQLW